MTSSTIVRGKYVLTDPAAPDGGLITEGAVYQEDGRIVAVGSHAEISRRYTAGEEVGSDEFLVMPGLINAHHHAWGLSSLQLGNPDVPLESWVGFLWSVRAFDPYNNILYPALRLIEAGVTSVIHSHSVRRATNYLEELDAALQAYVDVGMRVAFAVAVRDVNSFVYDDDARFIAALPSELASRLTAMMACRPGATADAYFSGMDQLMHRWHGAESGRVKGFYAPLNMVWCSDPLLQRIKAKADDYQTGIHTHLAETIYQREYPLRRWKKTGTAHLADLGLLGPNLSAAHGVWLTEADLRLLADHAVTICTNPSSNLRLHSGIAPVLAFRRAGVNVALGMDSTTINDDEDFFNEMRLGWRLHQTPGLGAEGLSRQDVFNIVYRGGAAAGLWGQEIGTLTEGKRADLILLRLKRLYEPMMADGIHPADVVLYQARSGDVDTVMIDGRVVMRERRHLWVDKAKVADALREQSRRAATLEQRQIAELIAQIKPHITGFYRNWLSEVREPFYIYNNRRG